MIKSKIISLYNNLCNSELVGLGVMAFYISLVMWFAAKIFIEPSIIFTFKYIQNNLTADKNLGSVNKI